jgi:hypothetical protein
LEEKTGIMLLTLIFFLADLLSFEYGIALAGFKTPQFFFCPENDREQIFRRRGLALLKMMKVEMFLFIIVRLPEFVRLKFKNKVQ